MNGLLLRLLHDQRGSPGRWFWKLFAPVRQDLDRLFWCFTNQPWMGAPLQFLEDASATARFDGESSASVGLWRPGTLARYADRFAEESIELFGIDPSVIEPQDFAARFTATPYRLQQQFALERATVWLLYTDSTCWEIYARSDNLLKEVRAHLVDELWVKVCESRAGERKPAFQAAGVADVWSAMTGDDA